MLGLTAGTSTWVLVFFNSSPDAVDADKSITALLFRLVSAVEGETPAGFSMTAISSEVDCLFLDSMLPLDLMETIDFWDDPLILMMSVAAADFSISGVTPFYF